MFFRKLKNESSLFIKRILIWSMTFKTTNQNSALIAQQAKCYKILRWGAWMNAFKVCTNSLSQNFLSFTLFHMYVELATLLYFNLRIHKYLKVTCGSM